MPDIVASIVKTNSKITPPGVISSEQSFDSTPSNLDDFKSIVTDIFSRVDNVKMKERILAMENGSYRIESPNLPYVAIIIIH